MRSIWAHKEGRTPLIHGQRGRGPRDWGGLNYPGLLGTTHWGGGACRACTEFFGQSEAWRCFHAQYAARRVQLPLLFHQYVYDSANLGYDQASPANFSNFRRQFLESLLHESLYIFPGVPPPPLRTATPASGPQGGAHGTWKHPVSAPALSAPSEAPSPGRDTTSDSAQGPSAQLALKARSGPMGFDLSLSARWGDSNAPAPAVGGQESKNHGEKLTSADQESNPGLPPSGLTAPPATAPSPSTSYKRVGDEGDYYSYSGSAAAPDPAEGLPQVALSTVRNAVTDLANPLASTMEAAWQYISPFTQVLNASALQSILQYYIPLAFYQRQVNNTGNATLVPGSSGSAEVEAGPTLPPVTNSYRSLLQAVSLEGPQLSLGPQGPGGNHMGDDEGLGFRVSGREQRSLEGGIGTAREPVRTAEMSLGSPSVPREPDWQDDHPGTLSRVPRSGSTVSWVPELAGTSVRRALHDVSQRETQQAVRQVKKSSPKGKRAGGPAQETAAGPSGQVQEVNAPFTVFAPACHLHEIIDSDLFAFSHIGSTRLQEVLQEWFFDGGAHEWVVDDHQGVLPASLCEPLVPPLTEHSPRGAQTMADKTADRLWKETVLGTSA